MTEARDATGEALDLVDAVIYADVFDAAVSLDALHRFARVAVERAALPQVLATGAAARLVVCHRSGAYTLRGRESLADGLAAREARAERLRRRAGRVSRVLRHTPFVRGLVLTGSVAAGDASDDADVDLLVIVAGDRVGTVFALLGPASRLLGRRVFCPNFYLSERSLQFEARDVYVGHELGQARSVVGDAGALRRANPWLEEMFPNLPPVEDEPARRPTLLQRALEAPLRGSVGRAIERRARRLAAARLRVHYAGAVPEDLVSDLGRGASLRFHASDVERSVPERHAALRLALTRSLELESGAG